MKKLLQFASKNRTAGKYISSGLFKTLTQTICGFIILRWLNPVELGRWQSVTVFVGYIQILTLGTTSGLNRELPYWLGKGDTENALKRLQTAGFFSTVLSLSIISLAIGISSLLVFLRVFSVDMLIMCVFAFSTGALNIQTNFLGATYRSTESFDKLSRIQFANSFLYLILLPLIYFFDLWGYIAYQVSLVLILFLGYFQYRPYKIKYQFEKQQFSELVKVGFPIYVWNYLASMSRTIPRFILVLFGSPILVGLYSPAESVNAAMLNLPNYTNRYLFPRMSYNFGKSGSIRQITKYAYKAATVLFLVMLIGAFVLSLSIPYLFNTFFPKYSQGIVAAQITLFSGVFYSVNALFHNTLNSIKIFRPFKVIVAFRVIYIATFCIVTYLILKDLLLSVAIGALISEFLNMLNYIYYLKKADKS